MDAFTKFLPELRSLVFCQIDNCHWEGDISTSWTWPFVGAVSFYASTPCICCPMSILISEQRDCAYQSRAGSMLLETFCQSKG